MPYARLDDRALLTVTGEAAENFLQALVTTDLEKIQADVMQPSALLTPQGKILFEFLIGHVDDGFRLDVASAAADDLKKRLILYRLRAKAAIEVEGTLVFALWDEPADAAPSALVDRRFPGDDIRRVYASEAPSRIEEAPTDEFRRLRIRNAVAEAESDYPASDVFPHDVLLDQNGGVSFKKGCFVGQEVVSRMQHRGTARRRLMLLSAERHLTPGADIEANGKQIGTVLAAEGRDGFGLIRIDRLVDALAGDAVIAADGVPLEATIPSWAGFALPVPEASSAVDENAASGPSPTSTTS